MSGLIRRLAVGNPIFRPLPAPGTTLPVSEYGLPRYPRIRATRPIASSWRAMLLLTCDPPCATAGTPSTCRPKRLPACLRNRRSPRARCPNLVLGPAITMRAPSRPMSTSLMNRSGVIEANARSNLAITRRSMPAWRINAAFSGFVVSSGTRTPRSTTSGIGSNVSATERKPCCRASSTVRRKSAWWPRCTPSNTPKVTHEGRGFAPRRSRKMRMFYGSSANTIDGCNCPSGNGFARARKLPCSS